MIFAETANGAAFGKRGARGRVGTRGVRFGSPGSTRRDEARARVAPRGADEAREARAGRRRSARSAGFVFARASVDSSARARTVASRTETASREKKPSTSRAYRGRFLSHERCESEKTKHTHRNARNTTASTAPSPSDPVVGSVRGKGVSAGGLSRPGAMEREGASRRSRRARRRTRASRFERVEPAYRRLREKYRRVDVFHVRG